MKSLVLFLCIVCIIIAYAYGSSSISLLVAVDQVQNDSVIAAVERTIDIINNNNDTLSQYLLQYTTDTQVCTIQLYT